MAWTILEDLALSLRHVQQVEKKKLLEVGFFDPFCTLDFHWIEVPMFRFLSCIGLLCVLFCCKICNDILEYGSCEWCVLGDCNDRSVGRRWFVQWQRERNYRLATVGVALMIAGVVAHGC